MPTDNSNKRVRFGRILQISLGLAFLIAILFLISFTVKVTTGVSRTVDAPECVVRLQVLNGSGKGGVGGSFAKQLDTYKDYDIEIRIVDVDAFDLRPVEKSFVVSRDKDKTGAVLLAQKLGLDPSAVDYEPIERNFKQISATLVLGQDYALVKLPQISNKE